MDMPLIKFKSKLQTIGPWDIIRLPEQASLKLPTRGQAMVMGTINGISFQTPLEPDGKWGHWFKPEQKLLKQLGLHVGDSVTLVISPTKDWPEPTIPADIKQALQAHPKAYALWQQTTPLAHWEWVRWIRSTGSAATRARRIEVGMSKLEKGERRPCCWNRNLCTEPAVSKNGILFD